MISLLFLVLRIGLFLSFIVFILSINVLKTLKSIIPTKKFTDHKRVTQYIFTIGIYPGNSHPDQEIEHGPLPVRSLSPLLSPNKDYADFCHCREISSAFDIYINGIIQHMLLCLLYFAQLYVCAIHSLF